MLRTNTIEYAFTSLNSSITPVYLEKFFVYDGSVYTDETADTQSSTAADVTFSGTLGSEWYHGMDVVFSGLRWQVSTAGVAGVVAWEYSKGSGVWGTLTTNFIEGNENLRSTTNAISFTPPTDWATDTVNSVSKYWVRARVTTAYTTTPIGSFCIVGGGLNFASQTFYIPETSSRTFKNVILEITGRDYNTTGVGLSCISSGVKLSSTWNYKIQTGNASNSIIVPSASGKELYHQADFTSHFNTNFGNSTSQSVEAYISCMVNAHVTQESFSNLTAKLIITYEFDDTSVTTRIKTVRIPLESGTTTLTNTLAEIGTNQVPALDTFLPEASKTYRDIFFDVQGNEQSASSSTTDFRLCLALDNEAEHQDNLHEAGLISNGTYYKYLWKRTDMNTSTVHAFKARSTVTGRFFALSPVLVVTYEYDESTTSTVINSLVIPYSMDGNFANSTEVYNYQKIIIPIEEPATITLAQSGVMFKYATQQTVGTLSLKIGGQTARSYTTPNNSSSGSGQMMVQQRIDSGGAQGAGITLARGLTNAIEITAYKSDTNLGWLVGGLIYLNYTSGKHSSGTASHAQTRLWTLSESETSNNSATRRFDIYGDFAPEIPETNFHIINTGYNLGQYTESNQFAFFLAQIKSGEFTGDGWQQILGSYWVYRGKYMGVFMNAERLFQRYAIDLDTNRFGIETSRKYKMQFNNRTYRFLQMYVTYNTITYTASGTVTGYTGDGSGITVELHRKDTDECVGRVTTTTGGSYTFTWYDNTVELYAQARQDGTHLGRSDDTLAS